MRRGIWSSPTRVACVAALGLTVTASAASPATVAGSASSPAIAAATSTSPAHIDPAGLHALVTEQHERLEAQGIHIVTWGPDPRTGREQLTVQNLTPAEAVALQRAFGADNIILSSTPDPTTACGCPAIARKPSPWPGDLPSPRSRAGS